MGLQDTYSNMRDQIMLIEPLQQLTRSSPMCNSKNTKGTFFLAILNLKLEEHLILLDLATNQLVILRKKNHIVAIVKFLVMPLRTASRLAM